MQHNVTTPLNADAFYERGNSHQRQGNLKQALLDFEMAIALQPEYSNIIKLTPDFADIYYERGMSHPKSKTAAGAISNFARAIELNPNFANAYLQLGIAHRINHNERSAILNFNEAIRLQPGFAYAYFERGRTQEQQGYVMEPIVDYFRSIKLKDPMGVTAGYLKKVIANNFFISNKSKLLNHIKSLPCEEIQLSMLDEICFVKSTPLSEFFWTPRFGTCDLNSGTLEVANNYLTTLKEKLKNKVVTKEKLNINYFFIANENAGVNTNESVNNKTKQNKTFTTKQSTTKILNNLSFNYQDPNDQLLQELLYERKLDELKFQALMRGKKTLEQFKYILNPTQCDYENYYSAVWERQVWIKDNDNYQYDTNVLKYLAKFNTHKAIFIVINSNLIYKMSTNDLTEIYKAWYLNPFIENMLKQALYARLHEDVAIQIIEDPFLWNLFKKGQLDQTQYNALSQGKKLLDSYNPNNSNANIDNYKAYAKAAYDRQCTIPHLDDYPYNINALKVAMCNDMSGDTAKRIFSCDLCKKISFNEAKEILVYFKSSSNAYDDIVATLAQFDEQLCQELTHAIQQEVSIQNDIREIIDNGNTAYTLLGIHEDASRNEIKKAYQQLAIKLHADKNNNESDNKKFVLVKKAYEILINPNPDVKMWHDNYMKNSMRNNEKSGMRL